jgi:branched-chain amino acid transport system ATP-binding protein
MNASPALLRLERIGKRFGRVTVASEVSLVLGKQPSGQTPAVQGDALGIVGPNGAGKTSLFALISGDLAPDAGKVWFEGRDVTPLDAASRCRLGIGRTYQVPRAFERMTTFENVLVAAYQGALLRGQEAYDLAISVLEETELIGFANRHAGALTLLQRKRLEVARALATRPRLLLLDEVAGGLTDAEVEDLVAIVRRVRARGITIAWIEHVVRALTSTVDRLVCLAGGHVIADGDPNEVLASDAVKEVYLGRDFEGAEGRRDESPLVASGEEAEIRR